MALNKKYAYYIDREKLALVEQGSLGWESISTAGKTVRIFCSERADHMTVDNLETDEPTLNTIEHGVIPRQFHEALVFKVIGMGYKDPRNLQPELSQFFDNEYNIALKRANKYAKTNHISTGHIKGQEY